MPRGDRTGPMGTGAMTGRGAGYCAGYGMSGFANDAVFGRGLGMGYGRGRGWHHRFYATGLPGWVRTGGYAAPYGYAVPYREPDPEMEKQVLRSQAEALQSELDLIRRRLSEIETESAKE